MRKLTSEERKDLYEKFGTDPNKLTEEMQKLMNLGASIEEETKIEEPKVIKPKETKVETPKVEVETKKEQVPLTESQVLEKELSKNVHISFRMSKKDFIELCLQNTIKPNPILQTSSLKKTEKEVFNFVEDRIALGLWNRELSDLEMFLKIPEKELKTAHKNEIKRIQNMKDTYAKVKALENSDVIIPSTKQFEQMVYEMFAKIDLKKNEWFLTKYTKL